MKIILSMRIYLTFILLEKLNLYLVDQGIMKTLQEIKEQVDSSNPNDSAQCNDILGKFYTACDPNSETCANANQKTFQGEILYFSSCWTLFFM